MRSCAGCRKKEEKEEFLRFVEFEGELLPDVSFKLPGRGYNVCPSYKCIKDFVKRRFKGKLDPSELYTKTVDLLKDYFLHLLSLSHKTGITVVGQDQIKELKEREGTLVIAKDLSPKTAKRLKRKGWLTVEGVFSSEEIGNALRKERRVGALFVERVGLGRKVFKVGEKLVKLLKSREET
ncbi:DUF448 domain-containing protein [Thermovibrio sp.]